MNHARVLTATTPRVKQKPDYFPLTIYYFLFVIPVGKVSTEMTGAVVAGGEADRPPSRDRVVG